MAADGVMNASDPLPADLMEKMLATMRRQMQDDFQSLLKSEDAKRKKRRTRSSSSSSTSGSTTDSSDSRHYSHRGKSYPDKRRYRRARYTRSRSLSASPGPRVAQGGARMRDDMTDDPYAQISSELEAASQRKPSAPGDTDINNNNDGGTFAETIRDLESFYDIVEDYGDDIK